MIGPNANDAKAILGQLQRHPDRAGHRRSKASAASSRTPRFSTRRAATWPKTCRPSKVIPTTRCSPSKVPSAENGLDGEYFNMRRFRRQAASPGRADLSRVPVKSSARIPANPQPLFTRVDPQVDFQWWDGAPRQDMNDDDFGVRWTGYLSAPVSGTYQLGAIGMNAYELYLDGKELVRANSIHGFNYEYAPVELKGGNAVRNSPRLSRVRERRGDSTGVVAAAAAIGRRSGRMLRGRPMPWCWCWGLSPRLEGEEMRVPVEGFQGGDRIQLGLPRVQEELLQKVVAAGKPVVLVSDERQRGGDQLGARSRSCDRGSLVPGPSQLAPRSPMYCSATTIPPGGCLSRSTSPRINCRRSPITR